MTLSPQFSWRLSVVDVSSEVQIVEHRSGVLFSLLNFKNQIYHSLEYMTHNLHANLTQTSRKPHANFTQTSRKLLLTPSSVLCGDGLDQRVAPAGSEEVTGCQIAHDVLELRLRGARGHGCGRDPEPHSRQEGYDKLDLIHEANCHDVPPPESWRAIARSPHP
jgi:hypothetical protein